MPGQNRSFPGRNKSFERALKLEVMAFRICQFGETWRHHSFIKFLYPTGGDLKRVRHPKRMASQKLPHYLRAHRKRLALTQHEMAFLLGNGTATSVSRYEAFKRDPNLRQILAYLLIFQKMPQELFAGLYTKIGKEVTIRIKVLLARKANQVPRRKIEHKRQKLTAVLINQAIA